ncbi:MAG TPA: amino acid permease [Aequorivita sp.]|nr:amino acid permease [Aequorivita sp.]
MASMIGIGAMMGPGIFALPGELAKMIGPLGIVVYLVMGLVTLFTALNYSELGAALPIAGGGYSFTSMTLSKPVSFFTGWFFWIGNTLGCAMYAIIFAITIREYFLPGLNIPLIILITTLIFTAINFKGMSEALKLITVMNLIELTILIGVAILGISSVKAPNLKPLAPMGLTPFFPSMALIYISYVGFELITVASEEIINPGKTIPRAILITLFVGIAIYVFVVFVMMGAVNYKDLAQNDVPFIYTAERILGMWGRWIAVLATIMASLSAFSVTLGASARVLFALGRDGHFPSVFAKLHTKFRTPYIALFVCAAIVIIFGSSGVVKFAASMSDFGYLMGLGFVNFAVIALHKKMPNLRRPFKVILYPYVPIIGILSCWIFVPALESRSFLLGGLLTLIGGIIYLYRPINRAELQHFSKAFSGIYLWFRLLKKNKMKILIIDGGRLGRNIADRLLAKDELRLMFRSSEHQITFIEENPALCNELEARFHMPIIQGDGSKTNIIEQAGIKNTDVAIAASVDDGRNVIVALQAKRMGIPQVIAIVQDPDYMSLLEENGIVTISVPWSTAAMVENYLDRPGVAQLFEIGRGVASLLGVTVPEKAIVAGKFIKEIDIPKECVVAAVIRGNDFVVPRGETQIVSNDRVIFVGPVSAIKKAQDIFLVAK